MQVNAIAGTVLPTTALQQQGGVHAADSVVVESPLPGGAAEVARFLLNTVPPSVQIGGLVLAVLVAALVLRHLIVRRRALHAWVVTRSRAAQVTLVAVACILTAVVGFASAATWSYTQHSNDFCTGCHVMNPAFQQFADGENKHADLSCHDCHQQSLGASVRQLFVWVAERPREIGEHARVPNRVCENCHVTGDTARWQRVAGTAGHRVHLESDSATLLHVQCVTCHGAEVHRFRPVAETCGQSDCHRQSETNIVLGKMAEQTVRHCTSCHAFTADVPALATTDSARGTLVPGKPECLGCHDMRNVLADFDQRRDPHGGKCGTCHNPHEQKAPAEAASSCATSGCHGDWREEPFHAGASHRQASARCLTCHAPHAAKVDASDCEGCHRAVRARGRLRPPLPFDTTSALGPPAPAAIREESTYPGTHDIMSAERRSGPSADFGAESMGSSMDGSVTPTLVAFAHRSRPPPPAADSFPHARHERLACLVCHRTGSGHGRLTFERPRGCAICHHQAPTPQKCASCHRPSEYATPKSATVTVTVPGRNPRPRPVDFLHARHELRTCTECHTTPVTLAPSRTLCQGCHTEHHAAGRTCSSCHEVADPRAAHTTLEVAHQRCDACHSATTIAKLTPTRSLCSTCHPAKASGHYEPRECTVCHFLAEPGVYRSRLVRP